MPSAEIITIGTELLLGETVDTNTRSIALALRSLGIDLYRTVTIGDNAARIAAAIRESLARAEIVITTGGLGPTVDDPTRQAVAEAFGVELEFREDLWRQVQARVARYGRVPTENQRRQAYVPQGAIAIENPVGTAPAFLMERGERTLIVLPGVPREMETLLHDHVLPYLQRRYDLREVIRVRVLHTAGVGESAIDEQVSDLERLGNPTVGLAAHSGIVDVRITAKAAGVEQADRMIADLEREIRARLGHVIFGADEQTLQGAAFEAAQSRGWTLAALECHLDGALVRRLAGLPVPVERADCSPDELPARLGALRDRLGVTAAIGAAVFPHEGGTRVELALLTPGGAQTRRLSYGGHPDNAPRWAVNHLLDWLRLTALEG